MNGYIKSYRKVEDNPIICKDNDHFRVWYFLLHNATHKEHPVIFNKEKTILKKGQLITGRDVIAKKCNISSSKVQRILKLFEIEHQIEQQTNSRGRLITIINWENYQENEQQTEQRVNSQWTASEQPMNTNNNDKNDNNGKNEKKNNIIINIYDFVEQNFGRTLSPVEYEEINTWKDTELTRYAIKQAVLSNKCGTKYISRILSAYERENIKTVQQAQERERKYIEAKKQRVQEKYPKRIKSGMERFKEVLDNIPDD